MLRGRDRRPSTRYRGVSRVGSSHAARIAVVLETHIHADFASGARALSARAGATLLVSAHDRGQTFEVSHPHHDIADGERVSVGEHRSRGCPHPGSYTRAFEFPHFRARPPGAGRPAHRRFPARGFGLDALICSATRKPPPRRCSSTTACSVRDYDDTLPIYPGHGAGPCAAPAWRGAHHHARPERQSQTIPQVRICRGTRSCTPCWTAPPPLPPVLPAG